MTFLPEGLFGQPILPQFVSIPGGIAAAKLYRFKLPLKHSLRLKQLSQDHREGLVLEISDSAGIKGLSEISPLPGFSQESLDSVMIKTQNLLDHMIRSNEFAQHFLARTGNQEQLGSPSVANFGVEMALLSLYSNANHVPIGEFLFGRSKADIPVNGLIDQNLSDWVPEAERLVSQGFDTLKLKVGRINPQLEALGVKRIREAVGDRIQIRLDANRSWDLETAIAFGKAIQAVNVAYVEEPLQSPKDLPHFYNACGVHFAFDESLHHILDPNLSFSSYTGLATLVMKPTLIACLPRFLTLVRQAKMHGISVVLSSSYETDLGLSLLSQLAAGITIKDTAAGLATGHVFERTLSKNAQSIVKGKLRIEVLGLDDLDLSHCELVYEK